MPGVIFWHSGNGQYDHRINTIKLPCRDWCDTYEPEVNPYQYWLVVYHELAHYIQELTGGWKRGASHGPDFYSILTSVVLCNDFPLDEYVKGESGYFPGSLKRGLRETGANALAWRRQKK